MNLLRREREKAELRQTARDGSDVETELVAKLQQTTKTADTNFQASSADAQVEARRFQEEYQQAISAHDAARLENRQLRDRNEELEEELTKCKNEIRDLEDSNEALQEQDLGMDSFE